MNFNERLRRFQEVFGDRADVVFLPISADLQYLTGVPRDIPNYGRVIHPGDWLEGAWLIAGRAPVLALSRMSAEFGGLERLENIELRILGDWDQPAALVKNILDGFALPPKPRIAVSDTAHAETLIGLQRLIPDAYFISATDLLRPLRMVKSAEEIQIMREAGAVTEAAFAEVLSKLKLGMTELDIIAEVDFQLRRHGALGPSFTTSLYNSGPHYPLMLGDRLETWKRRLEPPVAVLFDFGAIYKGYSYDYGRTVAFGAPPDEFRRIHQVVMKSQRAGIAALQAGVATCEQVDATARNVIIEAGYGDLFRHRLGHAIGLDVHEPPFLTQNDTTLLQEGMLFTIEPSIIQSMGYSARVEDVVVVRPQGGEALTTGYQDLLVIE